MAPNLSVLSLPLDEITIREEPCECVEKKNLVSTLLVERELADVSILVVEATEVERIEHSRKIHRCEPLPKLVHVHPRIPSFVSRTTVHVFGVVKKSSVDQVIASFNESGLRNADARFLNVDEITHWIQ